jgi:hypothetical protein
MTTAAKTAAPAPAVTTTAMAATVEKSAPSKTAKTTKTPPAKAKAPVAKAKPVAAAAKPAKVKKPKLVRDSFTIPKPEYTVLDDLKQRALGLAQPVKKSELLRAGIKALAAMSDTALLAALQAVPAIKTGRPAAATKVVAKPAAKKTVKKA